MHLPWPKKKTRTVKPYEKLAIVYDYLMSHVNYGQWAEYIHSLIQKFHPETRRILDVACGTASLLLELRKSNYELFGCDYSLPMVAMAQKKCQNTDISVWRANMTNVAVTKPVDVVLCLYDSVNYLMDKEQIVLFLDNCSSLLVSSGMLIFDVCTERNSLQYFANYFDFAQEENFSYDRWSHYDQKRKIQFTEFKIRIKNEDELYHEIHQQRIYPLNDLLDVCMKSPFKLLAYYNGFSFRPATSRSNRIHFVLRKRN